MTMQIGQKSDVRKMELEKSSLRIFLSPFFCLFRFTIVALLTQNGLLRTAEEPKPAAPQPIPIREIKRRSAVDFESEVLPIFKANCLACHNQTASKSDLVLETPQTIRKGGESGPAV